MNEENVNEFELGITPEDSLKRSYNGMAPRISNGLIPWEKDIKVYDPEELESIEIVKPPLSIPVGGSQRLYIKQTPEIANIPELCWESLNQDIAWVNQDGVVYALAEGEATIMASKPGSDIYTTVKVLIGGKE